MTFVPLTIKQATAVVMLTRGYYALIDSAQWGEIADLKWHAIGPMPSGQVYGAASFNGWSISLHRYLMGAPPGLLVDHKDGDGLNCRSRNLRLATVAQNQANRHARKRKSGIKGVHFNKNARKWCAQIRVKNKRYYLGLHPTEEAAGRAYDAAARKHWGAFANTNDGQG